jgi:hypothetical protein
MPTPTHDLFHFYPRLRGLTRASRYQDKMVESVNPCLSMRILFVCCIDATPSELISANERPLLVADRTVDAAGLYQAALRPGGCLAKAHKHDRSGITWSPTRCGFALRNGSWPNLLKPIANAARNSGSIASLVAIDQPIADQPLPWLGAIFWLQQFAADRMLDIGLRALRRS